jgi:hypothetical protein
VYNVVKGGYMNKKLGMYSSIITFLAVFFFGFCMLLAMLINNGNIGKYLSYFSSIFIALGFILMNCSFCAFVNQNTKSFGIAAVAFSLMYGTINIIVYFTQISTVNLTNLSEEASLLLDFSKYNLFFNFDMLGYCFMSLSTFFIGINIKSVNKVEKILKYLLMGHGIFSIPCFLIPLIGIFNSNMAGGEIIGTIILWFWCIYFMPICILSYKYFKDIRETNAN